METFYKTKVLVGIVSIMTIVIRIHPTDVKILVLLTHHQQWEPEEAMDELLNVSRRRTI